MLQLRLSILKTCVNNWVITDVLVRILVTDTRIQLAISMVLVFNMISFQFFMDFAKMFSWIFMNMQINGFAYLKSKIKDRVLSFIWFKLLQYVLNIGCNIFNLLSVLSKFNMYSRLPWKQQQYALKVIYSKWYSYLNTFFLFWWVSEWFGTLWEIFRAWLAANIKLKQMWV